MRQSLQAQVKVCFEFEVLIEEKIGDLSGRYLWIFTHEEHVRIARNEQAKPCRFSRKEGAG